MIKEKQKKSIGKKRGKLFFFALVLGCFLWINAGVQSLAAATADVVAGEGRIRQSADKSSNTLASVKKGDKLDVLSQTTDSQGYTWYKVRIDADRNGYIRADLVKVTGTVGTESTSSSDSGNSGNEGQSTQSVVAVTVSETDVKSVKASTQARVRKGAGTNFDAAGGVDAGSVMSVSGMATGSDGKIWYQVSYNDNSKTITGFIREDLVEVTERAEAEPVVEEEVPVVEEVYEERPEDQDYYLKQMTNDTGESDWYLFNNIEGTSMSLTQMLDVFDQIKNKELKAEEQAGTLKIVVYLLAGLLIAAVIVITILVFKLRDAYEYEYEDEEEEEAEEDEEEEELSLEEEETPARKPEKSGISFLKKENTRREASKKEPVRTEEITEEEQEILGLNSEKTENRSWQSKDFLELDDDMEFEFLDL